MSQMTMSAPSRARVTACERPCPRAPPVMTATLPSSLPMLDLPPAPGPARHELLHAKAGIDRQGHAGDIARIVRHQPEDRVADVFRLDGADRERVHRPHDLEELLL